MILQHVGSYQLVYVKNYEVDYLQVADEFGMLDENKHPRSYASITKEAYVNNNGISMPSYRLHGKTVDIRVVNDSFTAPSNDKLGVVRALNYFPAASRYDICDYEFVSKFKDKSLNEISDSRGLVINFTDRSHKDLRGIFDLMRNLSVNNGKLFEPLIARYVYTSREMPRSMPLVGYFNLQFYLQIIRDDRSQLFSYKKSKAAVQVTLGDKPPVVKITGVKDNCAILTIDGLKEAFDCKKINAVDPMVIFSKSPLKIKTMTFPWSKIIFDKMNVFMTPILSKSDAWETLQGGIDLLSVAKK